MAHPAPGPRRWLTGIALPVLVVCLVTAAPRPAAAQTAAQAALALYEQARTQEQQLDEAAPLEAIRKVARAYQNVVLRYPRSGTCDEALWQAAGLLEQAWTRDGQTRDRDEAVKMLDWLAREFINNGWSIKHLHRLILDSNTYRQSSRRARSR